ncbi:MGMT family protein [Streptomyces sp. CB02115]|uniref:MGMT family protein n=1 Tax=Streptomyces sp. CB02115 TaxID=1703939 RepID=UPI000AFB2E08|nr:MGMT family protein [Streptomyces sp. CB02115]
MIIAADFPKVYPTPEVEEFTLAPARVEGEAAAKKLQERSRSRNAVHVLVGAGLLPEGTRLRLTARHGAPESIRNAIHAWVEEDISRATATWTNNTAKPLIWEADGASYSPTGLANHIFTSVTRRTADGIQGTTWWDVDTDHVPADVDPEEWSTLAGVDLSGLARQLYGIRKDWTGLHTLLSTVPAGRWTTYGDVAAVIGSHAVPVGTHLATCGQCPNPWRVLNAAGRVSDGFQWPDRTRTETPADVLAGEGVLFNGDAADPETRLPRDDLPQLFDGREDLRSAAL